MEPSTFVVVAVTEGKTLIGLDSKGFSDSYLKLLGSPTWPIVPKLVPIKSQVIKKSIYPKWNFKTTLFAGIQKSDLKSLPPLKIEIWDLNFLKDKTMGYVEIPLSQLESGPIEMRLNVLPLSPNDKVRGSVQVFCTFVEVQSNPTVEAAIMTSSDPNLVKLKELITNVKGADAKSILTSEVLLNWVVQSELNSPLTIHKMELEGKPVNDQSKKLITEMFNDKEFASVYAEGLFRTLDVDHNRAIDYSEICGLLVLLVGTPEEAAKLKFKAADEDHDGVLSREELKRTFEFKVRSTLAAYKVTYRIGLKTGYPTKHKQMYDKLKIDESVKEAEEYFAKNPDIFDKLLELVLDFADPDKKGTLTEAEYVKWETSTEQQAILKTFLDQHISPYIDVSREKMEEKLKSLGVK